MSIRIIVTGGTFDKRYDEIEGTLTFHETHLPDIMRQVRVTIPVEVETNQLIDSLHMTTQDRLRILEACRQAPESQLIVTHGTDTIVETAHLLGEANLRALRSKYFTKSLKMIKANLLFLLTI